MPTPPPMLRSLWADSHPPAAPLPALEGACRSDVLIVGGGFTGVAAALALAERGISTRLLEASTIGWGASGRNGGQIIPGLKYDPDQLIERYGQERGQRLIDTSSRNADVVFDLIQRHAIECDSQRQGWLQPAATRAGVQRIEKRAAQWSARGVEVEWLAREACAERLGTTAYLAGWRDPRAGSLNPLAFVRGLARAAIAAGAQLHEGSAVTGLTRHAEGWRATTAHGEVVAERVLLCTNGYTDALQPGLARSVIAANSFQIATRPLSPAEGAAILPRGEVASDARKLLFYFRRDTAGRLLFGGRGPFHDPRDPTDFRHLISGMTKLYPALKGVEIDYAWGGRVALTQDSMPHVHEPAPGLSVALGYNGRGVGMGTHLGSLIGRHLGTRALADALPLPVTSIAPIPLHGLQQLYVAAVIQYYRTQDWLER
ncbi:FAD-binding oxidoreductase [Salinicola endophyticus]|uniref:FAD-binding oxidoreductase n=1 Tax=Salinicola endophyticus TaxID=1949083 RepID=A0ABY8FGW3_9GAMM|nr:FAD-binding oxidoreductase [Salinicola endophyticus]WFF42059.1 FAD-binding oxidoreductase [Salinicola endophyticus]